MPERREVYKFGGASVRDAERIRNVATIIGQHKGGALTIVVSALGKTTNALEQVLAAFAKTQPDVAVERLSEVKAMHYQIAQQLFGAEHAVYAQLNDAFVEVEWLLEEPFDTTFEYAYDQIVSIGELASSLLLSHYLQSVSELPVTWMDARGLIRTDDLYREARVDWTVTQQLVDRHVKPALTAGQHVVTQGFIGSTVDNESTTLGREGSDYSAAILSFCLDATSMTIWKDVPGVLTADPRMFDQVTKLDRLSYREAIEMTYYGAKVIHPKTIKPLQNKSIPLFVKSFLAPEQPGTKIDAHAPAAYPPIITVERNQALVEIQTRDFSFIAEHHLRDLFNLIAEHRLRVNLMQNSAISFSMSVNDQDERVTSFAKALGGSYACEIRRGLELYTLRHADELTLQQHRQGKVVFMDERVGSTVQLLVQEAVVPVRKKR